MLWREKNQRIRWNKTYQITHMKCSWCERWRHKPKRYSGIYLKDSPRNDLNSIYQPIWQYFHCWFWYNSCINGLYSLQQYKTRATVISAPTFRRKAEIPRTSTEVAPLPKIAYSRTIFYLKYHIVNVSAEGASAILKINVFTHCGFLSNLQSH